MTGSASSFPLTRLAAKRNEMMKNGQILSNRDSITVLDRRMQELLERIDTNQAPNRLANLFKLWTRMGELEADRKYVEAIIVKKRIDEEFEKAYHDYAAWEQMFNVLDLRRKMVESEVKIAKDIQAMLTAEDAYELVADIFGVIIQAVNKFELDPKVLKYIQHELTRIVGDGSVVEAERDGGEVIDTE